MKYTLKLDITVPLDNDAGTVRLIFELPNYQETSPRDAEVLAAVSTEFFAWLVQKFTPKTTATVPETGAAGSSPEQSPASPQLKLN